MGKANESQQHQQALHRNLVYLASFADTTQNMSQLLPVSYFHFDFLLDLNYIFLASSYSSTRRTNAATNE